MSISVIHTEVLADRPELNALHSAVVWAKEFAEEAIREGNEVRPLWVIVAGQRVLYVSTPWEDEEMKAAMLFSLRETMRKFEVKRYCFMCETWISTQSEEAAQAAGGVENLPKPSEDPNSRDGLIVLAADKEAHEAACYEVKYDDSGSHVVRYLEELKGYSNVGGRMADLLKV